MNWVIIGIIVLITLGVFCYFIVRHSKDNTQIMSFKASSELVGLPIITFYNNKNKLHFLLDTGADKSMFSKDALKLVEHVVCEGSGIITDASGNTIEAGVAYIKFYYEEMCYDGYYQLVDMSPISNAIGLVVKGQPIEIVGIIGDDFLTRYEYVLDFQKMIAYPKS